MTLSEGSVPVGRQLIHDRRVTCQGFLRDDGLWDIEGRLVDVKSYAFPNRDRGGEIPAGQPIHEMLFRLTLDDQYVIRAVFVETLHAPFALCGDITPNFSQLVGIALGPGFRRVVNERFSGVHGCTHLVEMLGPIATTAFQTIAPLRQQISSDGEKPRILDSCHALASDGPIVAREWPKFSSRAK